MYFFLFLKDICFSVERSIYIITHTHIKYRDFFSKPVFHSIRCLLQKWFRFIRKEDMKIILSGWERRKFHWVIGGVALFLVVEDERGVLTVYVMQSRRKAREICWLFMMFTVWKICEGDCWSRILEGIRKQDEIWLNWNDSKGIVRNERF